jgi:hypothetical protein
LSIGALVRTTGKKTYERIAVGSSFVNARVGFILGMQGEKLILQAMAISF